MKETMIVMGIAAAGLLCLAIRYAHARHVRQRKLERACRKCRGETKRTHRMIDAQEGEKCTRFSHWYKPFTLDVCLDPGCQHVRHVKGSQDERKQFSLYKLLWRRMVDPEQFSTDQTILVRSGIIERPEPTLYERAERMQQYMKEFEGSVRRLPSVCCTASISAQPGRRTFAQQKQIEVGLFSTTAVESRRS